MNDTNTKLDFALHLDFSAILTNPILDIAAQLWEPDRYQAFRVCYRSMRLIDDLVDDRKSGGVAISESEVAAISQQMLVWLEIIRAGYTDDPFAGEFIKTLKHFDLPLWPWERLCNAMIYDLEYDGFSTFLTFARYAEGAAISPAAIFMHLCGAHPSGDSYTKPRYDIRLAARPLAIFSYLVHIMRDFEKDQVRDLNYFTDTSLHRYNIDRRKLKEMAVNRQASQNLRQLMAEYKRTAEFYRDKARAQVDAVLPYLEPRYQLSVEMIYSLYLQIYERIDPEHGEFTSPAVNPAPGEVEARIEQTIRQFVPVPVI